MKVTKEAIELLNEIKQELYNHEDEEWAQELWLKAYSLSLMFDKNFMKDMRRVRIETKFSWLHRTGRCGCLFWIWSKKPYAYNLECARHGLLSMRAAVGD